MTSSLLRQYSGRDRVRGSAEDPAFFSSPRPELPQIHPASYTTWPRGDVGHSLTPILYPHLKVRVLSYLGALPTPPPSLPLELVAYWGSILHRDKDYLLIMHSDRFLSPSTFISGIGRCVPEREFGH